MYFKDLLIQYWNNYVEIWENQQQPQIHSNSGYNVLQYKNIDFCTNFRLDIDYRDLIVEFEQGGTTFYLGLENVINPANIRQQKIARDLKAQLEKEEAEKKRKTDRYEQYLKLKAEFENKKGGD